MNPACLLYTSSLSLQSKAPYLPALLLQSRPCLPVLYIQTSFTPPLSSLWRDILLMLPPLLPLRQWYLLYTCLLYTSGDHMERRGTVSMCHRNSRIGGNCCTRSNSRYCLLYTSSSALFTRLHPRICIPARRLQESVESLLSACLPGYSFSSHTGG